MKFAKALQSEVVLEWSTKYIDYKGLKGKLRAVERAKHTRENRLSSTTFRRSLETNRSHANDNPDSDAPEHYTPSKPQGLFSNSSQRAMSFTSIAESTGSLLNKVSSLLTNWKKHSADFILPEHNPKPTLITSLETLMLQANRHEREFFTMLNEELEKVNHFYESKEKESFESFEVIKRQYSQGKWDKQSIMADDSPITGSPDERQQKEMKNNKLRKLIKKALFEIYRGTELLRKYRALNQIGFVKALKKYDKIANVNVSKLYLSTVVNEKNFIKSSKLVKLIREIEDFYSVHFEEGSRRRSMKKLRIPNKKNVRHYSSTWKTGMYLGMALPFFIQSVYLAIKKDREIFLRDVSNVNSDEYSNDTDLYHLMQLYAGMGIPIILMLILGVNMNVWTRARINYKFIFEFDPRDNIDHQQYLEIPSILFLALSFFMYLTIENTFGIHPENYPKILMILNLTIVFMPLKKFYHEARRWFIITIARIFGSPFTTVGFREFFIADELTSLSYSFVALQLFFCTCSSDDNSKCTSNCFTSTSYFTPILASIPAALRSLQCLRRLRDTQKSIHKVNFGKYLSTILAICMIFLYRQQHNSLTSKVGILWVTCQCIYSTYTFVWDIKMDWRLLQPSSNLFLRDQLAYRRKWVYYYAIVADLILRWSWILVLINDTSIIGFVIAFGEVLRRGIWNFFRVENDHANNCAKSRAIGIDKIINKLMSDPIIKEKDLQDFSIRTSESEGDGWKDFETRNDNEKYEYSEYEDDEDDDYEDDEGICGDDSESKKCIISMDLYEASYASRRLPLTISDMAEIPETEEIEETEGDSLSSLSIV